MERVLLAVLEETKGLPVEDPTSRQDRCTREAQFVHEVLPPDAEVLVLEVAFLLLLEAVGDLAGLQLDGERDGRLFLLPVFVGHVDFFVFLAWLAGGGVASLGQLNWGLVTLSAC